MTDDYYSLSDSTSVHFSRHPGQLTQAGFLQAGWTGFWDESWTNLGRRDTPRPIFRVTSRPVQESARPILERDEKSGRHTREIN